jgi:TonB family protein
MTTAAIALALLAAAPPVPAPPAASDAEVWALARKADKAPAYQVYIHRFPGGTHRKEAEEASVRGRVLPIVELPPLPTFMPPATPDRCSALLVPQVLEKAVSEEGRDYLAARRANRPALFEAYLAKYPGGACRPEMAFKLGMRRKAAERFKPIAGFGPLASRRLRQAAFTEDDYPAAARRAGESGLVIAEWEVSEDGFAEDCRIVQSSGSLALDEASCRLVTARMRYDPARDAAGAPTRSIDGQHFHWVLPID